MTCQHCMATTCKWLFQQNCKTLEPSTWNKYIFLQSKICISIESFTISFYSDSLCSYTISLNFPCYQCSRQPISVNVFRIMDTWSWFSTKSICLTPNYLLYGFWYKIPTVLQHVLQHVRNLLTMNYYTQQPLPL